MRRPNHTKQNRLAIIFAIAIVVLFAYLVSRAIAAPEATAKGLTASVQQAKPTPVPIVEPNVYVRVVLGPNGPIYTVAFQYAGGLELWDDCDNCAKYLREHRSFYELKLPKSRLLQGASYCYGSLKTSAPRCNPEWSGKSRLSKKRPGRYLSEVFYAYYDGNVLEAPKGLCDPTLKREVCPK